MFTERMSRVWWQTGQDVFSQRLLLSSSSLFCRRRTALTMSLQQSSSVWKMESTQTAEVSLSLSGYRPAQRTMVNSGSGVWPLNSRPVLSVLTQCESAVMVLMWSCLLWSQQHQVHCSTETLKFCFILKLFGSDQKQKGSCKMHKTLS